MYSLMDILNHARPSKMTIKEILLVAAIMLVFLFLPYLLIAVVILVYLYNRYKDRELLNKLKNFTVVTSLKEHDQYMSHEEKQDYLSSPKWASLRHQVLQRDNHTCQSCGSTHNLTVHHTTYKNLGNEHLSDLVTLCNYCHNQLHLNLGYSRSRDYPIKELTC